MLGAVIASPSPSLDHEAITHVVIYQEQNIEDQGPIRAIICDGLTIYDEKSKIVYGKDSKQISLNGMLTIHSDVQALESEAAFQGFVQIGAERKQIYTAHELESLGVIYSTEVDLL